MTFRRSKKNISRVPSQAKTRSLPARSEARLRRLRSRIIVAIDGPAGAGKSTVAKLVAQKLHFLYIDTGALYRALTFKAQRLGISPRDAAAVCEILHNTSIELRYPQGKLQVLLDNEDVSLEIRKPRISDGVSEIAKIKEVRAFMTRLQRDFAKNNNAVLEGRDIGTVVFPDTRYKFYIDADFKERAARRFKELNEKKENVTASLVEKDLAYRDTTDSTRQCAPLKRADDAVYIDTTPLSIDQVVDKMIACIKKIHD